ncbi:MAG: methyltransferase [Clostridia bacterium]|nr:methyltransferase [Clostridia bacterium]
MLNSGESIITVNENIRLIQRDKGHTFGTDAYLLSAFMLPKSTGRALELGTGTGVISLLSAVRNRFMYIDALEVQPEMADIAERNVVLNALEDRIRIHNTDVREWRGEYDAVFSNPPYIKADSGHHNPEGTKNASRREIFGTVYDFVACASRCLKFGGAFYCVFRPDRLADLFEYMRACSIEPKRVINVYPDASHQCSLVLVEGRRGGGSGSLFVTPPFLMNGPDGESEDCKYVYERGEFGERFRKY